MKRVISQCFSLVGLFLVGCAVSLPLAPGAEKIEITRNADDLKSCKPVGNIQVEEGSVYYDAARNQGLGLGGDTIFDATPRGIVFPQNPAMTAGIVYICHPLKDKR